MNNTEIKKYITECADAVEHALEAKFVCDDAELSCLYEAMAYSTLGGGKRIRAFLVLEFCRMLGGDEAAATEFACALEMVHAFSLIHDDLPCMDDDDMRRGKPSCHIKYGEAHALIAGDALIMLAFSVAACASKDEKLSLGAVKILAERAGALGMCGGQTMDMNAEERRVPVSYLEKLQSLKTGALIEAAVKLGCLSANASEECCADGVKYASCIGRAFQIVDDILDVEGDEATLGKRIGSDAECEKSTFVTELGLEGAKAEAKRLTDEAVSVISKYENSEKLISLAKWLLERRN